jgi:FkbM family methyltransferase
LRRNGIANVAIVEAAVSDHSGFACFEAAESHATGRLAPEGNLRVPTVTLDEIVLSGGLPPPDCIKIDVEGGEARVLEGGKSVLSDLRPTIFLATHGEDVHRQCCQLLRSFGYELKPMSGPSLDDTDSILAFRPPR